jgi:hypothetical protein
MQLEVTTVENAFLWATFLPLLVLSIFLKHHTHSLDTERSGASVQL